MAHPYVQVNGPQWTKTLEHFRDTVAALAALDGKKDAEIETLIRDYVSVIEEHRDRLFVATAQGIVDYISFYNVQPKEGIHDEFKGIYFTGLSVSRWLTVLQFDEINRLHLRAMLRLLDYRLAYPNDVRRPKLTERIFHLIGNGGMDAIQEHLGKYGWYLIYKCVYNSHAGRDSPV